MQYFIKKNPIYFYFRFKEFGFLLSKLKPVL